MDGVIHSAGQYRIGIKPAERAAMRDANVGATERVLDAAVAAGVKRIVYVSTANAFGNTRGEVVDETYRRDEKRGFVSWYDETKYRAHQAAEARIAQKAPIVIVMPTQVYGPNDHSEASAQLEMAYKGTLRFVAFPSTRAGLGPRARPRTGHRGRARQGENRRVVRIGGRSASHGRIRGDRCAAGGAQAAAPDRAHADAETARSAERSS